jgi:hypothetical protein
MSFTVYTTMDIPLLSSNSPYPYTLPLYFTHKQFSSLPSLPLLPSPSLSSIYTCMSSSSFSLRPEEGSSLAESTLFLISPIDPEKRREGEILIVSEVM